MKKFLKSGFVYLILLVIVLMIAMTFISENKTVKSKYSVFLSEINDGYVKQATVYGQQGKVEGTYNDKYIKSELFKSRYGKDGKDAKGFVVNYSPLGSNLEKTLTENKVNFTYDNSEGIDWTGFVPFLFLAGILIFIVVVLIQQMQGGGNKVMQFGKAKAKKLSKDHPKTTFKDVAGIDEAVEELKEIKEFLSSPGKFLNVGAKIPKGVLLYGPPGSGKTLLARAVAGEAGVPFFSISGSDFVEMFVGVGASRVRDLFEQAKMNAPSIVFMDEIDAVGRHRGAGLGGGHDEREQTLNQLLVEMDGFDIKDNVILIAATNRPDILDPALLRPGRFDRQIVVDRPDLKGRFLILKVHTRNKPLAKGIDLEVLARRTPGFTGADLANMVNEAALLTARHGKKRIEMDELEESIDRVIAGPERKTRLINDSEKEIIAYHESGHALVAHVLPNTDPVHKISIIPRGRALGYTLTLPTEDRYLVAKSELLDNLAMLLGGRVAEEMVFHNATTGAQDDLRKTSKIARQMVCEYGMSEKLGPLTLGQKHEEVFLGKDLAANPDYSPEIAFEIDKEIRRIIDDAWDKAKKILEEHRNRLDLIAKTLIENETIEKEDLKKLLEGKRLPKPKLQPKTDDNKESLSPKKIKDRLGQIPGKLVPGES